MRTEFVATVEHFDPYNTTAGHAKQDRKKAAEACPWACKIVPVCGGYMCFESWADYGVWRNQK